MNQNALKLIISNRLVRLRWLEKLNNGRRTLAHLPSEFSNGNPGHAKRLVIPLRKSYLFISGILLLCLLILQSAALGSPNIAVMGLFRDKAVLLIDGKRRILTVGERSTEGVKLISANSKQAVIEMGGKRNTHTLGSQISTSFAQGSTKRVSIYRNPRGMFTTVGSINGLPVNFLVDTGASAIAMSILEARRLGLNYKMEGKKIVVRTASGLSSAYAVKLNAVKLGDIVQRNVDAIVIDSHEPATALLGMSYLGHLNITNEGVVMHLEQRY
jgi:aspartyl protease family protein